MLLWFYTLIALFIHVSSTLCSLSGIGLLMASRLDLHASLMITAVPSLRVSFEKVKSTNCT